SCSTMLRMACSPPVPVMASLRLRTWNTAIRNNRQQVMQKAPIGRLFCGLRRPGKRSATGQNGGWRCAYPPYKRSDTQNVQTKKKTSCDVFLLEYWYRGWDSNPQAR